MKKATITLFYNNEEMFNSVLHLLHCLDCEAFQVSSEKEEPKSCYVGCPKDGTGGTE